MSISKLYVACICLYKAFDLKVTQQLSFKISTSNSFKPCILSVQNKVEKLHKINGKALFVFKIQL